MKQPQPTIDDYLKDLSVNRNSSIIKKKMKAETKPKPRESDGNSSVEDKIAYFNQSVDVSVGSNISAPEDGMT